MFDPNEIAEMQRQVQEKGALQYERERQEKQQLHTPVLYTSRTLEFHQHVLTPIKSELIEAELQQGLPLFTSKAKKKAWKAKMNNLLASARAREEFYKPMETAMQEVTLEVDKLKEKEKQGQKSVSVSAYIKLMDKTNGEAEEHARGLYRGKDSKIMGFCALLEELCRLKSQNHLQQEQMISLVEKYNLLRGEIGQDNADMADMLRDVSENKYNYQSCYVFLFHAVATTLSKHLNELQMDQVNVGLFAKLQGWIVTSGTLAAALKISPDFKSGKEMYEKEKADEEAKKSQRKRELEEMTGVLRDFLITALAEEGKEINYAEVVDKTLDDLVDSSTLTWKDIILGNPEERFCQNQESIKNALENRPEFVVPKQKKEMFWYIVKNNLFDILKPMDENGIKRLIDDAMGNHSKELKRYQERRDYLAAYEGLNRFQNLSELDEIKQILSSDESEDVFKERVKQLSARVVYNLGQAEALLRERISPVSHELVFSTLMKPEHCGIVFLSGTRQEIMTKVAHYLREDVLEKMLPGIVETEKKVRDAMVAAKLNRKWKMRGCQDVLATDSLEEMTLKMKAVRIDEEHKEGALNLLSATRRYPVHVWKQLVEWQNKNIALRVSAFYKGLEEQIKELNKQNFPSEQETLSYREFLDYIANEKQAEPIQPVAEYSNSLSLRGAILCEWEGFSGLLKGYEDDIMEALEKNLKAGKLKHSFLKKVKNNDDLNNLTYEEFQMLINRLRVNIGKCIQNWYNLQSMDADRVRVKLLPEMLEGTLNQENFHERAHQVSKALENADKAREMRFRFQIGSKQVQPPGILQYQYIDDTDSTAAFTKRTRAESRLKRFKKARSVWEILEKYKLMPKVVSEAVRINAKKPESKNISHNSKKLHEYILKVLKGVEASDARTLYNDLSQEKEENYINEFWLCGLEEFLLDKENNLEAYTKFTSHKRDEYEPVLNDMGSWVMQRMQELLSVLDKFQLTRKMNRQYIAKMRPLLAGLREGTDSEIFEENSRKFGVASWRDALQGLEAELEDLDDTSPASLEDFFALEKNINLIEERQKQLNVYKGEILQPILPRLYKDDEFWMSLVADDQVAFAKQVETIYQKLETPLMLLDARYSYGQLFKQQVINALGDEMLHGEERDRQGWIKLYDEYFDRFCRHKVNGISIKQRYEELIKKDPKLASYFTTIILGVPEGLELLTNEKKYEEMLFTCGKHVEENEGALKAFLDEKKELSAGDRISFTLCIQRKIPFKGLSDFQAGLETWYKEFEKLRSETLEQTTQTEEIMSQRAKMLLDVAEHRNAGMSEDGEENLKLQKLRMQMRTAGSPLLAALGVKKMPTAGKVEKAKDMLKQYGQLSKSVEDCLFERILSGAKKETLDADVKWLQKTNEFVEKLNLDSVYQSLSTEAELLMFLFINHRDKTLTEQQVSEEYQKLGMRHAMVGDLMDRDFTLAMKFRPNAWSVISNRRDRRARTTNFALKENSAFAQERHMVMEAMTVGIYTMKDEEFENLISKKTEYFKTAVEVDRIFNELIDEYVRDEKEKQEIRIGLKEYFHADIVKGRAELDAEELREKVKAILKDETYRRCLVSGGRMEAVGYDSLTDQENTLHTVANRKTLENILAKEQNEEFREAYSRLSVEQRQVFALVVLQTDSIYILPSARYVCSSELVEGRHKTIDMQLDQYASHGFFQPQIPYDRVLDILCQSNGKIDKTVFAEAMKRTESYIRKHQDNIPRDWSLLSDGVNAIEAANRIFEVNNPANRRMVPEQVSTLEKLKEQIRLQDMEDKKAKEQKKRLEELDTYGLQLLAEVLQDRTMLDYSTHMRGKKEPVQFVNVEKRQLFKEFIQAGNLGERMYTLDLTNALTTLMGFQLRDDVVLDHSRLAETDFAPKALERKTQVDWALLERAIDFVQEMDVNRLRN